MRYFREVKRYAIVDHTDDRQAQRDGWDFMLQGSPTEFKECNRIHQTKNLVFELVSNSRKATPGCMLTSKATFLCYYDTKQHIVHLLNLPKLKGAIECASQAKWDAYKVTTPVPGGTDVAYATFGLLVPLRFLDESHLWHPTYHIADFIRNIREH